MNRRDTFKAFAGGLLGLLGIGRTATTWRSAQVGAMVTCYQVDGREFVDGMKRATMQLRVFRANIHTAALGKSNDRTLFGCPPGTMQVQEVRWTPASGRWNGWWDVSLDCVRVCHVPGGERADIIGSLMGREC